MSKSIHVRNFAGIKEVTLHPKGNLVVIAGSNGAGKSSLINAVSELFNSKGVKLYPKPIRDGEDEAYAEYVDEELDLRISRTWKKDGTAGTLTVEALDGARYSKPSEVIARLTGGLIFDPVEFLQMDEKKQRDALLAKVDLPFDIDEVAREKQGAEGRRLEAGRDVKRLEGALASIPTPAPGTPAEEVSSAEVAAKLEEARAHNRAVQQTRAEHLAAEQEIARAEERLAELRARVQDLAPRAAQRLVEEEPLIEELGSVDAVNRQVRAAQERARVAAELAAARTAHETAQSAIDAVEAKKAAGLAAASFPVEGLSVDESGVTFQGIPFAQVNSAMRRRIAFAIATAGDPELRLVIVKDGDLLDAESLEGIRDIAARRGYTALIERDRDESRQIGFTIVDGALGGAA
jgi:DNA repair exonuclease SbcCD ATPase subunit